MAGNVEAVGWMGRTELSRREPSRLARFDCVILNFGGLCSKQVDMNTLALCFALLVWSCRPTYRKVIHQSFGHHQVFSQDSGPPTGYLLVKPLARSLAKTSILSFPAIISWDRKGSERVPR